MLQNRSCSVVVPKLKLLKDYMNECCHYVSFHLVSLIHITEVIEILHVFPVLHIKWKCLYLCRKGSLAWIRKTICFMITLVIKNIIRVRENVKVCCSQLKTVVKVKIDRNYTLYLTSQTYIIVS